MSLELYQMDITEIDGFDNLHAPEGILLNLQKRVADLYGSGESFCLVGGSTCGILSAISAAVPAGGRILMARNCHKSAYHGAYLRGLQISYLWPPVMREWGIADAITPEQVRNALEQEPDIQAVMIVSPTYEGRIARIREIAEVVHEYGKILIVDEAHGAHLGLYRKSRTDQDEISHGLNQGVVLYENSCQAGADLVIHSVHKTLPAMTQTALLHVNGSRVDRDKLKRFLHIYQSSSPSYVLMASIDNAITMVEKDGEGLFTEFRNRFEALLQGLRACRKLKFPAMQKQGLQDTGKLIIWSGDCGVTGQQVYDRLRQNYHLQLEMAAGDYCLAMFTIGDTQEGYDRMLEALLEMDRELQNGCFAGQKAGNPGQTAGDAEHPEVSHSFAQAWDMPCEEIPLKQCSGRVAGDFVNLYPPGVPLLVPGERFTDNLCEKLTEYLQQGLNVQGVTEDGKVRCLLSAPKA